MQDDRTYAEGRFREACGALAEGRFETGREALTDAAHAGHGVAARLLAGLRLAHGGVDAARAVVEEIAGNAPSLTPASDCLIAELERFHRAPAVPIRDDGAGGSPNDAADAWSLPLARAALAGDAAASGIVSLYAAWAPALEGPPRDPRDGAAAELAAWLAAAESTWTPPPPQRQGGDGPVSVRVSAGFVPGALCAHVSAVLAPKVGPSLVVDPRSGARIAHPVRTARAAQWLPDHLGWAGKLLQERLAVAGGYPAAHGEVCSLLAYGPGQEYRLHTDCLPPSRLASAAEQREGGQRVLTQLLGIRSAAAGGETRFPRLGITLRLGAGDLMSFRNVDDDGAPLADSQHAGAPIRAGEKQILSKWVRESPTPYGRLLATTL